MVGAVTSRPVLLLERTHVPVAPHVAWDLLVDTDHWQDWMSVLRCASRPLGRPVASGDEITLEVDASVGTRHSRVKVTICREPVHLAWTHDPLDWGRNSTATADWFLLPRAAVEPDGPPAPRSAAHEAGTLIVNRRQLFRGDAPAGEWHDLAAQWQASVRLMLNDLALACAPR